MNIDDWIDEVKRTNGIDLDGYYGKQCMDLYNHYCINVLGTKRGETGCESAKYIVSTSNNTQFFDVYRNTLTFLPKKGDVAVWTNGIYGHVAIVIEDGNMLRFKCIEQNHRGDRKLTVENHRYSLFGLYFLRPKNQTNIINEDKENNNQEEYKLIKENGTFKVTVNKLNVRELPTTKSKTVAQYVKGETIYYDGYIKNDGYVWISYIGKSGNRRYVATGNIKSNGLNDYAFGSFY